MYTDLYIIRMCPYPFWLKSQKWFEVTCLNFETLPWQLEWGIEEKGRRNKQKNTHAALWVRVSDSLNEMSAQGSGATREVIQQAHMNQMTEGRTLMGGTTGMDNLTLGADTDQLMGPSPQNDPKLVTGPKTFDKQLKETTETKQVKAKEATEAQKQQQQKKQKK